MFECNNEEHAHKIYPARCPYCIIDELREKLSEHNLRLELDNEQLKYMLGYSTNAPTDGGKFKNGIAEALDRQLLIERKALELACSFEWDGSGYAEPDYFRRKAIDMIYAQSLPDNPIY